MFRLKKLVTDLQEKYWKYKVDKLLKELGYIRTPSINNCASCGSGITFNGQCNCSR